MREVALSLAPAGPSAHHWLSRPFLTARAGSLGLRGRRLGRVYRATVLADKLARERADDFAGTVGPARVTRRALVLADRLAGERKDDLAWAISPIGVWRGKAGKARQTKDRNDYGCRRPTSPSHLLVSCVLELSSADAGHSPVERWNRPGRSPGHPRRVYAPAFICRLVRGLSGPKRGGLAVRLDARYNTAKG